MKNIYFYIVFGAVAAAGIGYGIYTISTTNAPAHPPQANARVINVVAAENFYGDIVKQLGGNHVIVLSVLSDPNADPHQYEPSVQDAIAVEKAGLVVENGSGYDGWMDKLLSSSPNEGRVTLVATEIAVRKLAENPHVWYGFDNMRAMAKRIARVLKEEDPSDAAEFDQNFAVFEASLKPLNDKVSQIQATYQGTPVGLTETIYLYQAEPEGLNVLTPYAFEKAIAEGNDPSADDVAKASDQVANKEVKVLIYNKQTLTPVTTNLQNQAISEGIAVVPITETLPRGKTYQEWMRDQLINLEDALQSSR